MNLTTYGLHISDWESVRPQITQDLVIKQLLLDGIIKVDVVIKEEVFLKQEHVMPGLTGQGTTRCPIFLPFGHDVGYFFIGQEASFLGT